MVRYEYDQQSVQAVMDIFFPICRSGFRIEAIFIRAIRDSGTVFYRTAGRFPPSIFMNDLTSRLAGNNNNSRVVQILSGWKNVTKICLSNPIPLNVGINNFD